MPNDFPASAGQDTPAQPTLGATVTLSPGDLAQATPAPKTLGATVTLSPEDLAQATPASPAKPVNLLRDLSPQELADMAKSQPDTFNLIDAFNADHQARQTPAIVQNVADAFNLYKQQKSTAESLKGAASNFFPMLWQSAKGFGKQVWNYAGLPATALASVAGNVSGQGPEFQQALVDQQSRRMAESAAGTESALTGLGGLAQSAAKTAYRALPGTKTLADFTPGDKVNDLFDAAAMQTQQSEIARGHGAGTANIPGFSSTVAGLESRNMPVRPEQVADLAAGDPMTWWLAGKAFGGVGAVGGKVARVTAKAVLPEAVQASLAAVPGQLSAAAAKAGGAVVQAGGKVGELGARVLKTVAPVAGAVGGVVLGKGSGEGLGPLGGVVLGYKAGQEIAKGAERASVFARGVTQAGKEMAGTGAVTSRFAQLGRDVLQATPGAVGEVAKGAAFDAGLAGLAETPEEARSVGFGAAFGLLGAGKRMGGWALSGQLIGPREWGAKGAVASSGQFPALDTMHQSAMADADPGVRERLNAIRQFAKGAAPGTDVFLAKTPEEMTAALTQSGMDEAAAKQWAENTDGVFTKDLPGKDGAPRRVIIAQNVEAAPHEATHALQDVLGESASRQVDSAIHDQYADVWDAIGERYARDLLQGEDPGSRTWQEVVLDRSGWGNNEAKEQLFDRVKASLGENANPEQARQIATDAWNARIAEAAKRNPHLSPAEAAQGAWRDILTPDQAAKVADRYNAREIWAELGDSAFKHDGLTPDNSAVAKMAQAAGKFVSLLGGEPYSGRVTRGGVPIRAGGVEAVSGAKPVVEPALPPSAKQAAKSTGIPATPEAIKTAATEAQQMAGEASNTPVAGGTESPREILGKVAEAIAGRGGIKINYLSAPEEPAAATTSNRVARRAIIETFRAMPQAARALWEKMFFPERVIKTKGGKYQVMGWAPEVFAANAHKLAESLSAIRKSRPEVFSQLGIPYELDPATKSFTPAGWQELYRDAQTFVENHTAGATGSGAELVVPKDLLDAGFTQPGKTRGNSPLDQTKADFINSLFNFRLPDTARIQNGKLPLNIVGQRVSEATAPGRVQSPVRPRGTFEGKAAADLGIEGAPIQEVNPFRNKLESAAQAAGVALPSFIEAIQRLNLENIKDVQHTPEAPQFRANSLTLTAGFSPKPEPRAVRAAAVKDSETGRIFTGRWHPEARLNYWEALRPGDIGDNAGRAENNHPNLVDGFVTNEGEFLSRADAFDRAVELGQYEPDTLDKNLIRQGSDHRGRLESVQFQGQQRLKEAGYSPTVQYQPKQAIEVEGPDGKKYKAMFDGYQDFRILGKGMVPQITMMEEAPGFVEHTTTYGTSLTSKGYKLPELPAPGEQPAGQFSPKQNLQEIKAPAVQDSEEGFVTNGGEFLNRKEAFKRAVHLGQYVPGPREIGMDGSLQDAPFKYQQELKRAGQFPTVHYKAEQAIKVEGPDGTKYRAMFDGYQDLNVLGKGMVPQITMMEEAPGFPDRTTTYGTVLSDKGFKLPNLPSPRKFTHPQGIKVAAVRNGVEGFMTNDGEFLNRKEAFKRAVHLGQYIPGPREIGTDGSLDSIPFEYQEGLREEGQFPTIHYRPIKNIEVEGPNGTKYRAMFDGYQDLTALGEGMVPQITMMEEAPGFPDRATTYGTALQSRGYKLPELPAPGEHPAGQFRPKAEEQAVNALPEDKLDLSEVPAPGRDITNPQPTYHEAVSNAEGNRWVRRSANPGDSLAPDNKGRTLLMQFSSDLLTTEVAKSDEAASAYYDKLYSGARPGYARMQDFWEIPQWMGFASHMLPNADVYVIRNMAEAKQFLGTAGYDRIAFSALDLNKDLIREIAKDYPGKVDVGGYIDPKHFAGLDNVTWHPTMKAWAEDLGVPYKEGTDYRHFAGSDVIPRLTMSQGCRHKCAFCTVPKKLDVASDALVEQQADSIAKLGSKLVYLNDKTFGQAPNYTHLADINERIKAANPDFKGFVVQTTATQLKSMPAEWLAKSGIKFVELGVESFNDPILRDMHKPATEALITQTTDKLRKLGIALIPNIIVGLPGETAETYGRTLDFLKANQDIISHANIYNLAIYEDAELAKKVTTASPDDFNENVLEKSFHTDPEVHRTFAGSLYGLASEMLGRKPESAQFAPHRISDFVDAEKKSPEFFIAGGPNNGTRKLFGAAGDAVLAGERQPQKLGAAGDVVVAGERKTQESLDSGDHSGQTGDMTNQAAPKRKTNPKQSEMAENDWKLHIGAGATVSKAWILPDGRPVQLGGQWHHEWVNENKDRAKEFGLVPTTSGEENRVEALQKGFARVNYMVGNGTLKVEARSKDWPVLGPAVREMVANNLPRIDNMDVSLLDDKAKKVVDSDGVALFTYDANERMDHLPLISEPSSTVILSPQSRAAVTEQMQSQFAPRKGSFSPEKKSEKGLDMAAWIGHNKGMKDTSSLGFLGSEELGQELIKVRAGDSFGQTFTRDGRVWAPRDVDIVSLASGNLPREQVSRENFAKALQPYKAVMDSPEMVTGAFNFERGGVPLTSADVNVLVPKAHRENTLKFARDNNQVSIWDAGAQKEVATGGDGDTRLTSPAAIQEARDLLLAGKPVDVAALVKKHQGKPEQELLPGIGAKTALSNVQVSKLGRRELLDTYPEAVVPKKLSDKIPSDIVGSPLYKKAGSEPAAVEAFAKRLVDFAKQHENNPAFQAGARWYSEFTPRLKKVFGEYSGTMAELLAATSPQNPPDTNYAYAVDALHGFLTGRFDKQIAKYKDGLAMTEDDRWHAWLTREINAGRIKNPPATLTKATFLGEWIKRHNLLPRQSNGALYGVSSHPVLQVLTGVWLDRAAGPKTHNFVQNLLGTGHEATIDLWADRTMRWAGYEGQQDRWRVLPSNVSAVSDADFAFAQKAFHAAAEDFGMSPDAFQGALWFAEKTRWADAGWGRLDLGDFRTEINKTSLLQQGITHRLAAGKAEKQADRRAAVPLDLDLVQPRN